MRRLVLIAAASASAFVTGALTVVPEADAQTLRRRGEQRIIVNVRPRSYLDAGNVVPVGSMNRYASQHFASAPAYSSVGSWFGEDTLPARIGAGVNPFANTFETPRF